LAQQVSFKFLAANRTSSFEEQSLTFSAQIFYMLLAFVGAINLPSHFRQKTFSAVRANFHIVT